MEDKRETPVSWLPLFERGNVTSAQQIADRSGVAVQTVLRLIHGEGSPSRRTLQQVAKALRSDPSHLLAARGEIPHRPFVLPAEADRLNARQRAAVVAVVKAMLEPAEEPTASVHELRQPATAQQKRAAREVKRRARPDQGAGHTEPS